MTVQVQTANGTATAGSDYTALPLTTLTFNPGHTSQTVTVTILGDLMDEPDETFTLNLSNATNATIDDGEATGTILNDDGPPGLWIGNRIILEGDDGTVDVEFPVFLLPASAQTVTVQVQTANRTATAGSDYTATARTTLTFSPGPGSRPSRFRCVATL